MPEWLLYSLIASVVLTFVLNLGLRLFPGLGRSAEDRFLDRMEDQLPGRKSRVKVVFPWKAMLLISVVATIALNVWL